MLVLSRKRNQSIQIGDNITVTVVRLKGNVVQLGIQAPHEIPVVRGELLLRDAAVMAGQEPQAALCGSIDGSELSDCSPLRAAVR